MTLRLVALVQVLAAIELIVFGFLVGRGRARYNVPAPATSGHPTWERLNRVHANSVEQFVIFTPLLWTFAVHVGQRGALMLGVVYVIARIVYAVGYTQAAERRTLGAALTAAVQSVLAVGAVTGIIVQIARSEG